MRCDTSVVALESLKIAGDFHFAVSPYSIELLEQANNTWQLKPQECFLRIDVEHMGIGGDDSRNPSIHPEFLLEDSTYRYQVSFNVK